MKCLVCGRKLRNPKSQEVGYGPVCYRRLFGTGVQTSNKGNQSPVDVMLHYEVPGQISMEDYLQTLSGQ